MNHSVSRTKHADGFTLIELLVVIVLIGIIATMGVLNLTHWLAEREARQEVQILRDQIRILMDDAVISQRTLALKIQPDHIKIYERREGGWQEPSHNNEGKIQLSRGIKLALVNPDGSLPDTSKQKATMEMVYLGSDGRVSPYRLRVQDKQTYCDLSGDIAGNMQLLDCATHPVSPYF